MLDINNPNFDPVKLLKEFREWGVDNLLKLRTCRSPQRLVELWLSDSGYIKKQDEFDWVILSNKDKDQIRNLSITLLKLWAIELDADFPSF